MFSTVRALSHRIMESWTTQPNLQKSLTCSSVAFLRLASLAAFSLCLFFVGVGSNAFASQTLVCCILRSSRSDGTIYDKKWVTGEGGASGGLAGDAKVYPQLATMNHTTDATIGHYIYWPQRYANLQDSPVAYYVQQYHPADIVLNTDDTNVVNNVSTSINGMFDGTGEPTAPQRAAINSLSVSLGPDVTPIISATTFPFGRVQGNSVATADSSGNPIISYPDSTGFVPGYEPIGSDGTYQPVYYDLNSVSGGRALRLSNLESVSGKSSLSYDSNTGLYSLEIPDYSTQLTAIRSDLRTIANKDIVLDNIRIELPPDFEINVPSPEVTVNPQVTVNPTVTVTPDVTVNVPAPEVNISGLLTVSDVALAVRQGIAQSPLNPESGSIQSDVKSMSRKLTTISQELSTIGDQFDDINATDFDTSTIQLTNEEQDLLNVAQGWNSQIPVVSNYFDVALNTFLGPIPDPGRDLVPLRGSILNYDFTIDFTSYSSWISIFRSMCFLAELIWFVSALWRTIIMIMQI